MPPFLRESPFLRETILQHDLTPYFGALRAFRRRQDLMSSPLYQRIGGELDRILCAVEQGHHAEAEDRGLPRLRLVAWNIQRGRRLQALQAALRTHPVLREADVLLLSEVDNGMARSGNRNVARELAIALRMNYAFGVSYLALGDDYGENPEGRENTLGLAGCAILSRLPLRRVENVDLPELRDKFRGSEKRLGHKRALLAELELPGRPLSCASVHLDSNASPRQRAAQLAAVLDRLEAAGGRLVGGGDLNTTTYDASATLPLLRDIAHKLFVTGFHATVDNYMTPERLYETPLFELLASRGFTVEGLNDRTLPTVFYDLHSDFAMQKVRKKVGPLLLALLQYLLRPWNGVVGARLDWFFGRNVEPLGAAVVDPRDEAGVPISDHAAVVLDIAR